MALNRLFELRKSSVGAAICRVRAVACFVLLLCLLAGCGKDEAPPEAKPSAPPHRMEDPQYVAALAEARKESKALAAKRWPVVEKMQAIVEKAKAEGKTPPDYPEWAALVAENEALIREIQNHNKKTQQVVRERIRKGMTEKGTKK